MQAGFLRILWPICALVLVVAFGLFFIKNKEGNRENFTVFLAFAALGAVTGYLAGNSREPAIDAVLPAVLSLVGGLSIYLIGKEAASRDLVARCVVALSVPLLVSALWGAAERAQWLAYEQSYENLEKKALTESRIRLYREELYLPPEPVGEQ